MGDNAVEALLMPENTKMAKDPRHGSDGLPHHPSLGSRFLIIQPGIAGFANQGIRLRPNQRLQLLPWFQVHPTPLRKVLR